jgi:alcohol dehydrogenase
MMAKKALAAVINGPRDLILREFEIPQIGPDEGLLKVEMAGVCGGDPRIYNGKLKHVKYPLIPGHEILGHIEEIGDIAATRQRVSKGDRVVVEAKISCGSCFYCLTGNHKLCEKGFSYGFGRFLTANDPPYLGGAYAQYLYLAPGTILHKIQEDVPAEAAVLTCAVIGNGIQWASRLPGTKIGDAVVIQGIGQQGLAAIIGAREAGASPVAITGLSMDEYRFPLAKEFGADYCINVEKEDVIERVNDITKGRMADVVVDVTGNANAVVTSIDLVRPQGTVVVAGDPGKGVTSPIETEKLVTKEIKLQGAHSRGIEAVNVAVRLVESKKYPFEKMVTHKFPLREVEKALLTAGREIPDVQPIKVVILPWS